MRIQYNNRKLKIMQLTDIHYCDGRDTDLMTLDLMEKVIGWEQPDLIFITGDIMTLTENADRVELVPTAMKPITDSGIPWCFVFGNHDREDIRDDKELYDALCALPGCINPPDPEGLSGLGNYCLEVAGGEKGDTKPEWVLFGIDSQMYSVNDAVEGYGYIFHDQVSWFRDKMDMYNSIPSDGKRPGDDYSALVFMHIPLPEYNDAWNKAHSGDPDDERIRRSCKGDKFEDVCCPQLNTGMFASMIEKGHVKGVFAGHDHINDYDIALWGIRLVYGRACGYSEYGREGFLRGARIIEVTEGDTSGFKSYCRLSDGSILSYEDAKAGDR